MNKIQELDKLQINQVLKNSTKTKNARLNNSRTLRTQRFWTSPSRDLTKPDSKCNKSSNLSREKVRLTRSNLRTRANSSSLTKFRKASPSSTKTFAPKSRVQLHQWRSYHLSQALWDKEIRPKNKYPTLSRAVFSTFCKPVLITFWTSLQV